MDILCSRTAQSRREEVFKLKATQATVNHERNLSVIRWVKVVLQFDSFYLKNLRSDVPLQMSQIPDTRLNAPAQ